MAPQLPFTVVDHGFPYQLLEYLTTDRLLLERYHEEISGDSLIGILRKRFTNDLDLMIHLDIVKNRGEEALRDYGEYDSSTKRLAGWTS